MNAEQEKLFKKIITRIKKEEVLVSMKRAFALSSSGAVISAAAFVPFLNAARAGTAKSGFFSFFSLLFSDFGTVIYYWQSFFLSLLETFPAAEIAGILSVVVVFSFSAAFAIKSAFIINKLKTQNGL